MCNQFDRDFENDSRLILGLDTGKARCGLARADATHTLASPLAVIPTHPLKTLALRISEELSGQSIGVLVAGLPLDQHGKDSEMSEYAREMAHSLAAELNCRFEFIDERFTTAYAERMRVHAAKSRTKAGQDIDAWAAAAILQSYLDQNKQGTQQDDHA